jgi:RNA polymerase sigma factor (sigma-70 family)
LLRNHGRDSLTALLTEAQGADSNDTPAMNEIVRCFDRLAKRLAAAMTTSSDLREDLANAARLGLVGAVRRHDLQSPGFPAYAEQYMRGAVLREYQKWAVPLNEDIDELAHRPVTPKAMRAPSFAHAAIERLSPWGDGAVATAVAALAPDQREILRLRYIDDLPLRDIAIATGTTMSAASRRLRTIHSKVAHQVAA